MPKDTFKNLNENKKKRIFESAVQEFSTRRFSEASLNQIVKAAGIPWGSFYQYFDSKEDLYLYVLDEIRKEKKEVVRDAGALHSEDDVFKAALQTTKATLEWSRVKPEYTRISLLMEIDDSDFITRIRTNMLGSLKKLIELEKERGQIKPETDSDLVADMIYTLIWKQYSLYSLSGMDEVSFLNKLNQGLEIIKKGIEKV